MAEKAFSSKTSYSYDNAGNITSKKRYMFTAGTLGSVLETKNYTYGDSSWGDLLTSFNGTSISYNTIGNPTGIGDWELYWQGRELIMMNDTNAEVSIDFFYNSDT